jgi:hypothetical protein
MTVYTDALLTDFYIDENASPVSAFTDDNGETVILVTGGDPDPMLIFGYLQLALWH